MGMYAVFTIATSLLVAVVLIPVLRLIFTPTPVVAEIPDRPSKGRALRRARPEDGSPTNFETDSLRAGAMAGGLGVLLSVAVLVPVGGDGFLLNIVEPRLAIAMLLALGLLLVGMTRTYQRWNGRQRFWLQLAFAATASVAGLIPSGVRPEGFAYVIGALFLVASMNALRALDSAEGLASLIGAITASVMALVASSSGTQAWGDLNLGLCGALLALLAYNLTHGRFRAELGTGGTLAVGFLLGASMLRLGEQTVPTDRVWLALPMAIPLLNLAFVLLARHIHNRPLDIECPTARDHLHHQLLRAGLTVPQVAILFATTTGLTALVSLQFLGLL